MKRKFYKKIILLLVIAITITSKCAYLNTFYNAKIAFSTGRREQIKFYRTRVDTTLKMPSSISDKFDRAIQKSGKVLEVYPKDKKWHDDAVFLMGKASYFNNEFGSAIRRFRRLQREFPGSPYIPESYLFLGKSYLDNGNLDKAEETFNLILQKYPKLNDNDEITLLMARLAIKREGKSKAIALLEKTLKSVKTYDKHLEILLQIADLYIDLKQYDNALVTLKGVQRKRKYPVYMYRIDDTYLTCYMAKKLYEKAISLANHMLKVRQYVSYFPEILLKKGLALKESGDIDNSIKVLESVTSNKDSDKSLQGIAWFELAKIYQKEIGNFTKAKEYYDKAITLLTDEEIKKIAIERADAIAQFKSYRTVIAEFSPDTSDSVDSINVARYNLGELFWLKLDEPDSALRYFENIVADTLADDTTHIKSLYASAWIFLHLKEDSSTADSLFKKVIEIGSASIFAKRAQQELGVPVTIHTRKDSSVIMFKNAESKYFDDNNAISACKSYLRVAKKYPDQEVAPKSIYAAAWLCDNVLNKNVTAQKLYKKLCKSFPQSELCIKESKPRLKVVQDTLEAIKADRNRIKK